jgi:hypothetical protein
MAKKIIVAFFFTLMLTWGFWRLTGFLAVNREIDNFLFAASPVLAIVISVLLVRSRFMADNRKGAD